MNPLSARDGYRLWAKSYDAENAISFIEDGLATAMTPPLGGLRLLDVGCGTGRRLRSVRAAAVVGVDLSPEMLSAGTPGSPVVTLVGDVRALPLPDAAHDVVWCRLVIGHLPECRVAYAELARVAAPGAVVIVTDFHSAAHAAGHRRTFRADGRVHEVEHHVHPAQEQIRWARAAGLEIVEEREGLVGAEVERFYARADRMAHYRRDIGLPVVLALAFRKVG